MPKKHQQRALLTKPQSSSPHTLSLSKSPATPSHNASSQRTVNDLIRESRRLQIRNEPRPVLALNATSIPPSLREVLDIPPPPPPAPRVGTRSSGPSRLRRIPGPPVPTSWLTDSIHAPRVESSLVDEDNNRRVQNRTSNLPEGLFPPPDSLQHLVLKKIASNWGWHAEHDYDYLEFLPTNLKETLLSYIAVYNEVPVNPLKVLFFNDTEEEDRDAVRRLDLSNGLGAWATLKQLERVLVSRRALSTFEESGPATVGSPSVRPPESWDVDDDSDEATSIALTPGPEIAPGFKNLKHLSLAISPTNARAASWISLLSLATELRTLTSLSLAYWPLPTFTPIAASTRAVIKAPGSRPVVYGGSDIYTSYDNNWREAAGILRTLSRSLYCLQWLDLTGCGDWFAALQWSGSSLESSSPERLGPEWNGGWRGLETLVLEVGWTPIMPSVDATPAQSNQTSWDVENERHLYRYNKERERYMEICSTAKAVARHLRAIRKDSGGKWIQVDCSEDLTP
ncbi:hypothetical protein A1O3_01796 [Capronia epimyces CBS 606.96]|uniref:Tafazzin n=1 Tax=Capronia epimyces CBS 606.96 TaxID=1182542 RepID=W9ZFD9_9EURO|nr:uncharacterized protein A1O3_01796 [Capronia epimyces CBS 606.96]EXJ93239.1 hypothetical protein A1O3_01796 [Capronia epimyces CBS 606.96]